jgi:hypothetical protein
MSLAPSSDGMRFSLPVALGVLLVIVAVGVGGLAASDVMAVGTIMMMVAPSMLVFGLVAFGIGVKHGEFRVEG